MSQIEALGVSTEYVQRILPETPNSVVLYDESGKTIATDVHVLSDVQDEYNADFMRYAKILFLSDENIPSNYKAFMRAPDFCIL